MWDGVSIPAAIAEKADIETRFLVGLVHGIGSFPI